MKRLQRFHIFYLRRKKPDPPREATTPGAPLRGAHFQIREHSPSADAEIALRPKMLTRCGMLAADLALH